MPMHMSLDMCIHMSMHLSMRVYLYMSARYGHGCVYHMFFSFGGKSMNQVRARTHARTHARGTCARTRAHARKCCIRMRLPAGC